MLLIQQIMDMRFVVIPWLLLPGEFIILAHNLKVLYAFGWGIQ